MAVLRSAALFLSLILVSTACRAQPAALEGVQAISGAWKVIAVELRGGPVQALTINDPIYMGAVLDVSAQRLAWRIHKGSEPYLSDVCLEPRLKHQSLHCASGDFGPPGSTLAVYGRRIVLVWYDNANLVLERVD